MTSIDYEDIFSDFLGYVTDYDFAQLDDETAYNEMIEWLHKSLTRPYVRRIFKVLDFDDNIQMITYELESESSNGSDEEFVKYIAAKGMVCEWLEPKVKKSSIIHQMFGGKEQKFYAQSSHLNEIRTLLSDSKIEVRRMVLDRGYVTNAYLEES